MLSIVLLVFGWWKVYYKISMSKSQIKNSPHLLKRINTGEGRSNADRAPKLGRGLLSIKFRGAGVRLKPPCIKKATTLNLPKEFSQKEKRRPYDPLTKNDRSLHLVREESLSSHWVRLHYDQKIGVGEDYWIPPTFRREHQFNVYLLRTTD